MPQYPLTASNDWSGGATLSSNFGNCDRQPIAASKLGSPGPTGSGSSLDVKTEPEGDTRNCGRVDMSYFKNQFLLKQIMSELLFLREVASMSQVFCVSMF